MRNPAIHVNVTLFSKEDGGRSTPVRASPQYRPHFVVGDPHQHVAQIDASGRGTEDYLGVAFQGQGKELTAGISHELEVTLLYWPNVNYEALRTGEMFTIREGGHVVGFGIVLRGAEQSS